MTSNRRMIRQILRKSDAASSSPSSHTPSPSLPRPASQFHMNHSPLGPRHGRKTHSTARLPGRCKFWWSRSRVMFSLLLAMRVFLIGHTVVLMVFIAYGYVIWGWGDNAVRTGSGGSDIGEIAKIAAVKGDGMSTPHGSHPIRSAMTYLGMNGYQQSGAAFLFHNALLLFVYGVHGAWVLLSFDPYAISHNSGRLQHQRKRAAARGGRLKSLTAAPVPAEAALQQRHTRCHVVLFFCFLIPMIVATHVDDSCRGPDCSHGDADRLGIRIVTMLLTLVVIFTYPVLRRWCGASTGSTSRDETAAGNQLGNQQRRRRWKQQQQQQGQASSCIVAIFAALDRCIGSCSTGCSKIVAVVTRHKLSFYASTEFCCGLIQFIALFSLSAKAGAGTVIGFGCVVAFDFLVPAVFLAMKYCGKRRKRLRGRFTAAHLLLLMLLWNIVCDAFYSVVFPYVACVDAISSLASDHNLLMTGSPNDLNAEQDGGGNADASDWFGGMNSHFEYLCSMPTLLDPGHLHNLVICNDIVSMGDGGGGGIWVSARTQLPLLLCLHALDVLFVLMVKRVTDRRRRWGAVRIAALLHASTRRSQRRQQRDNNGFGNVSVRDGDNGVSGTQIVSLGPLGPLGPRSLPRDEHVGIHSTMDGNVGVGALDGPMPEGSPESVIHPIQPLATRDRNRDREHTGRRRKRAERVGSSTLRAQSARSRRDSRWQEGRCWSCQNFLIVCNIAAAIFMVGTLLVRLHQTRDECKNKSVWSGCRLRSFPLYTVFAPPRDEHGYGFEATTTCPCAVLVLGSGSSNSVDDPSNVDPDLLRVSERMAHEIISASGTLISLHLAGAAVSDTTAQIIVSNVTTHSYNEQNENGNNNRKPVYYPHLRHLDLSDNPDISSPLTLPYTNYPQLQEFSCNRCNLDREGIQWFFMRPDNPNMEPGSTAFVAEGGGSKPDQFQLIKLCVADNEIGALPMHLGGQAKLLTTVLVPNNRFENYDGFANDLLDSAEQLSFVDIRNNTLNGGRRGHSANSPPSQDELDVWTTLRNKVSYGNNGCVLGYGNPVCWLPGVCDFGGLHGRGGAGEGHDGTNDFDSWCFGGPGPGTGSGVAEGESNQYGGAESFRIGGLCDVCFGIPCSCTYPHVGQEHRRSVSLFRGS